MTKLEYDKPYEVSEKLYHSLIVIFAGIIAHREEGGKYWIKLWAIQYRKQLEEFIENN